VDTTTLHPAPRPPLAARRLGPRHDRLQVRTAATVREGDLARIVLARQRQWLAGLGVAVEDHDPDALVEYDDPWSYYREQQGALVVATLGSEPVGVVTLRPIEHPSAENRAVELRRFFVVPEARGLGAGPALLDEAIDAAARLDRPRILLESVTGVMDTAIALYRAAGFVEIAPCHVDLPGIVAMERRPETADGS
jgi:GNAT superfamily N-acetyltransferase